jgi:UDP-glucose 4-epimerase
MRVLVTGGTGFIGSHTSVLLLEAGHEVVILDNLSNSKREVVSVIEALGGKAVTFYKGDMCDGELLDAIFAAAPVDAVMHFAGLKALAESVKKPLEYYGTNIGGTVSLCEAMRRAGCNKLVFSSSATVYGSKNPVPFREEMPTGEATNPYGQTKIIIERILRDLYAAAPAWHICLLRYFNPTGAHPSGLLGENPNGVPNNLMPLISQAALGKRPVLEITGDDYETPDGTGVRDYIHVMDLAEGHVKALEKTMQNPGCEAYNLGSGKGLSVRELLRTFCETNGVDLPTRVCPRRPGDIAYCFADAGKARRELGWEAKRSPAEMCADVWRYLTKSRESAL